MLPRNISCLLAHPHQVVYKQHSQSLVNPDVELVLELKCIQMFALYGYQIRTVVKDKVYDV